jgi:hypothetical protein
MSSAAFASAAAPASALVAPVKTYAVHFICRTPGHSVIN